MIRAFFTALAALALAVGAALWFDDDGGREDESVTATAESASAVDPAPAVKAEEGPAVARSGASSPASSEDAAARAGEPIAAPREAEASAAGASDTPAGRGASSPENVELARPDFLPGAAETRGPDGAPAPRPALAVAPVDPERSAALIRRMLALYEVVRE